jgi:autotransporter-associated beta strand protein
MTATFICGHAGLSHENSDNGHIDLFAFGVPLALDSMSGPYDPDPTASTWNNHIFAHNTVRFQGQEPTGDETPNGTFNAFGSSDIADYVSGNTKYGTTSVRRVVFVKPDYLVVWDQCNASSYSDFWLHTPAQTLEWQDHKVVSHTPWNVDLDVDFLLPSGTLPLPTLAATNPTSDYTTRNTFASQVPAPTGPALYTTQGEGRFGEWTNPNDSSLGRNPFAFKRQTFFSVRAPTTSGHYLTVWHPRKVGVTPALTATLTSSTSTSVALSIDFNGRTDTITINTSGATVTKGGAGTVQFSETYPQSGVSGAARFVKSGYGSTTLASALTTTGAVEVTMGTVTLGASERIPNTAPLNLREGGTFDLGAFNETVGDLLLDGGTLTGTGTLNVANTEVWGGTLSAPVSGSGALHKKGAAPWTLSANLSYAGDTFIDGGTLSLNSTLPGTKNLQLAAGAVLDLNTALTLPNTSSLTWSGSITGTGTLVNNGTLQLVGTGTFGAGVSFTNNGTLDLSNWSGTLPPSFVNNGTVLARPTITTQPQSQTAAVAHNAQLTAAATGTGPLTYRWYLNGVALSDGGVISGATTTTLTLTGLTLANAGSYTFVATNPYGSATSAAAVLTLQGTTPAGTVVNDPFTDGDRTNTLGGDLWGLRWYQSAASGITFFDDSSGIGSGKALDVVPSATFSRAIAEFPTVSLLNSGDSVTLQFDIRFRSDPASATDSLRFGLYNTNGTSTSADGGSSNAGGSQTNRTDDFGYGVRTNVGGTSSGSRIFAQAAPGGSSGDLLSGTTTAMGSTAASSAFGHTSHPVALQITRNGDATLTVTATFDSNTFSGTTNGGSIPTLTYSFNEIGITNGSTSNEFLIDNVSVSTNATPNIAITSPTTGATFITLASSVALSGTAADHQGLTQVAWTNSAGGSGIATGSTSWSIASIPLVAGANVLTVSAQDADGNTATAVLTVTRLVPGNLQFSASAYQLNESAGAATISVTRTGGSDGAVSVGWATSNGTATAGVDYTAASGTLNWANGDSATKSFSIQLLAGTATSGDSTVNLALNTPTGSATLGSPASAALTIHHTPSDHWRFVHFGGNANNPALADDLVDPNGNGLVNLLEFALLGEPLGNSAGQSALPVAGRDATQHLTLSFMHSLERSDLTLTVEGSDAPGGPWMDLAQSAAGGSFVSLQQGVEVSESGPNDARAVMVSDLYTFGDPLHPQRFLRLEATH